MPKRTKKTQTPNSFANELLSQAEKTYSDQVFRAGRVEVRQLERESNFFITSAQNNTLVHRKAHETFMRIAKHYNAIYKVIPIRYKNPTGYAPEMLGRYDRWAEELHPFMLEDKLQIHERLAIMGEWRLQATTQKPLVGLNAVGWESSAIYGHGRLEMKTVAVPSGEMPKILYTTGSVTQPNYSTTGLGQKGKDQHIIGGVLVRKIGRFFIMRHMEWSEESQSVQDMGTEFTPTATKWIGCPVVVNGDEHWICADPMAMEAIYGEGGLVDQVRPNWILRHDALDSYAISHHHENNQYVRYMKAKLGINNMDSELRYTLDNVIRTTPDYAQSMIVASNHHDHFFRWLRDADPRRETVNHDLYRQMQNLLFPTLEHRRGGVFVKDAFMLYATQIYNAPERIQFLERMTPFCPIKHVLHLHGDKAPGGKRGSPQAFAAMGVPSITGHIHAPWIYLRGKGVGHASEEEREYVESPSRWLHTAAVENPNGTSQLIHTIKGRL